MYKIGIVGYGVVGRGIHRLFKEDVVAIYDPVFKWVGEGDVGFMVSDKKENFKDLDMVVISVPTNETRNGSADVSILNDTLDWVGRFVPNAVKLIKSTTPPSVIRDLHEKYDHVVFSPEYMGESKYFTPEWKYPHPQNMQSHTWQTFGGDTVDTSKCVDIFKRRMGVDCQYWQTDIVTASLAKYIENSFFALKVTFVNEWFDIAQNLGADWNELRELWLLDPRINRNHTLVFPNDRGYGGKCFPKDVKAIIYDSSKNGYKPNLLESVDKINTKFRKLNNDGRKSNRSGKKTR